MLADVDFTAPICFGDVKIVVWLIMIQQKNIHNRNFQQSNFKLFLGGNWGVKAQKSQ